jgi:hypothetical protein
VSVVTTEGVILTVDQLVIFERGEIETEHPGYLGSRDTFYVGPIKALAVFISKLYYI